MCSYHHTVTLKSSVNKLQERANSLEYSIKLNAENTLFLCLRRAGTVPLWHSSISLAILTSFYSMAQRSKIHFPRISLRILAAIIDISTWHRIVCPQLSIKIMFIFITFISIDQLCRRWKGHKLRAWTVNSTCSKSPLFIGSRWTNMGSWKSEARSSNSHSSLACISMISIHRFLIYEWSTLLHLETVNISSIFRTQNSFMSSMTVCFGAMTAIKASIAINTINIELALV